MLGLPKTTEINKPLPKKAIFEKFKQKPDDRRLFDEQISRMAIIAEISPQTVAVAASANVLAIYIILVTLKTPKCDKKNITLLSKLIDQRMVFALQYEGAVQLATYHSERVLISESKPLDSWNLKLTGFDFGAVWENIIAQIGGIDLAGGKHLDETLTANECRDKLFKQIVALENKAMTERQPRRKWKLVGDIKKLKTELEELSNG